MGNRKLISIICEACLPPFDEGFRKYAFMLTKSFNEIGHSVKLYAKTTRKFTYENIDIFPLPLNKLFFSYRFLKDISKNDIVIYIPSSSATLASFFRNRLLSVIGKKVIFILMQPNFSGRAKTFLVKYFFPPFLVLVQHPLLKKQLGKVGIESKFVSSGVDLNEFRPVDKNKKIELRNRYGLPIEEKIILHVGHINRNRNLESLLKLKDRYKIVIVNSQSFEEYKDRVLIKELKEAGVRIFDNYLKNIQEIYQLSDCYVFPVKEPTGSVGFPLSVLEAMACNLPIVTTYFGLLPMCIAKDIGVYFFAKEDELIFLIPEAIDYQRTVRTREFVERSFCWRKIAVNVLSAAADYE